MSTVSVIGLGSMGTALAEAFLNHGISVTVWNRSPEKVEPLVQKGALAAPNLRAAIEASSLLVTCLLVYDTVHAVFEPVEDALAGRTLVNLTNGTPTQARAMADWAAKRGAGYVDGGIMAVPPMIGSQDALTLYSGSAEAFREHEGTLRALGAAQYLGSDAGLAPLYDIALLTGMYGLFSGVTHAFALVRSEKVSAQEFLPTLTNWLSAVMNWLPDMASRIDTGDYRNGVTSNLSMQTTAYLNFITASEDQGVGTELITPIYRLMQKGVAAGYGDADHASLVEMIRRRD